MGTQNKIDPNTVILGVVVIGLISFGTKIMRALGLTPSADASANAGSIQTAIQLNYFNPNFWRQGGANTLILTNASAQTLGQTIYNAKGLLNDNEPAVYGVFESLKTKSQVSFLADVFFQHTKQSLLGYLQSFLNDSELSRVTNYTNKLPDYRT